MESLAARSYKNHIVGLMKNGRKAMFWALAGCVTYSFRRAFSTSSSRRSPHPPSQSTVLKARGAGNSGSKLLAAGRWRQQTQIVVYLPVDYWHNVEPLPTCPLDGRSRGRRLAESGMASAASCLPRVAAISAISARFLERALPLISPLRNINPKGVIDCSHYYRSSGAPIGELPVCAKRRKWRERSSGRRKRPSVPA